MADFGWEKILSEVDWGKVAKGIGVSCVAFSLVLPRDKHVENRSFLADPVPSSPFNVVATLTANAMPLSLWDWQSNIPK